MFFSLENLTSIIRTGLPILVELIDLVNSILIFLFQMTLLRWITFLLWSQTVILWDLFISSDASICSTMAFPPLGNSDYVVLSASFDFPSNTRFRRFKSRPREFLLLPGNKFFWGEGVGGGGGGGVNKPKNRNRSLCS